MATSLPFNAPEVEQANQLDKLGDLGLRRVESSDPHSSAATKQNVLAFKSDNPGGSAEYEEEVLSLAKFETQHSSGSDEVELEIRATGKVKKRDVQRERESIHQHLSQRNLIDIAVVPKEDNTVNHQEPTTTADLQAPKEVEATTGPEDLVVKEMLSTNDQTYSESETTALVPSKPHDPAVFVAGESRTVTLSTEPHQRLPSSSIVKLISDLCELLEKRGDDLTPLREDLGSLSTRSIGIPGESGATSQGMDAAVSDLPRLVGELQTTAGPYFTANVNKHLPRWMTKSWMIFRLSHIKSDHCVKAFCSMCLETLEVQMIGSHVYSESLLKHVCGSSNRNVIWIALSQPPKTPTAPKDSVWSLECKMCDKQTSPLEQSFIVNRYSKGYYDSHTHLEAEDAILFHVYAFRGLQVNVDLFCHCFSCCLECVNYLLGFLDRTLRYRQALKDNSKPNKLDANYRSEAKKWVIFCTKPASECQEFLTEFPLICQLDLPDVNSKLSGPISLIYGQIGNSCREGSSTENYLCWAIPLVKDVTSVDYLRPHFPDIVDHINAWLHEKRREYFKSIDREEPLGLKLVVGFLKTCHVHKVQ